MKNTVDHSQEVTDSIMENVISKFKIEGDARQLKIQMMPIIANAMYQRDNELLENERLETVIALSRVLDNDTVKKAVKELRYSLTVKPTEKTTN